MMMVMNVFKYLFFDTRFRTMNLRIRKDFVTLTKCFVNPQSPVYVPFQKLAGDHFGVSMKKSGDHLGVNLGINSGAGIISGSGSFRGLYISHDMIVEHLMCVKLWYGMVWYGMVWYGMVWYGMVWYG